MKNGQLTAIEITRNIRKLCSRIEGLAGIDTDLALKSRESDIDDALYFVEMLRQRINEYNA